MPQEEHRELSPKEIMDMDRREAEDAIWPPVIVLTITMAVFVGLFLRLWTRKPTKQNPDNPGCFFWYVMALIICFFPAIIIVAIYNWTHH